MTGHEQIPRQERQAFSRHHVIIAVAVVALAAVTGAVTIVALRAGGHRDESSQAGRVAARMAEEAQAIRFTEPRRALRLWAAASRIAPDTTRRLDLAQMLIAPTPLSATKTGARSIETVVIAPHGRTVFVGGAAAELWSIVDRTRPVRTATVSMGSDVAAAAFTPDGRRLLVADAERVTQWDVQDPAKPRQLGSLLSNAGGVEDIAVTTDGRRIAVATGGGAALVDISRPERPETLGILPAEDSVRAVAFDPGGRTAYVGYWGSTAEGVAAWDIAEVSAPRRLSTIPVRGYVGDLAVSTDGRRLLSGDDEHARLWDVSDRVKPKEIGILGHHTAQVGSVAWGNDSGSAITVDSRSAVLWDLTDPGTPRYVASLFDNSYVLTSVVVSPDGRTAGTAGWDGVLKLWDLGELGMIRNGDLRPRPIGGEKVVESDVPAIHEGLGRVTLSSDGARAVTSAIDQGPVVLWDIRAPRSVRRLGVLPRATHLAVLSGDGRLVLAGMTKRHAGLWDVSEPRRVRQRGSLPLPGALTAAVVSMSGELAVTGSVGGTASIWDLRTPGSPRKLADLHGHGGYVPRLVLSSTGRGVLVTTTLGDVAHWDITDPARPRRQQVLTGHTGNSFAATFTHDDQVIVTADRHGQAKVWDADPGTGEPSPRSTFVLTADDSPVTEMESRAEGQVIAISDDDQIGSLWRLTERTGARWLTALPDPHPVAQAIAWSDSGRTAVVLHGSVGRMSVWSLDAVYDVLADPVHRACAVAGGGISKENWPRYARGVAYRDTCPASEAPSSPSDDLSGSWRVHGATLDIRADGTGTERWNAGPCRSDVNPDRPMCVGVATLRFTSGHQVATGTYLEVGYRDERDRVIARREPGQGEPRSGQKLVLRRVTLDVLQVSYEPPLPDAVIGYWCGPLATEVWRNQCNAW